MARLDLNLDWRRIPISSRLDIGIDRELMDLYVVRVFAPSGQVWPRLVLSLFYDNEKRVTYFSVGYKEKQGAWWDTINRVPALLANDLSEMWKESETFALADKESD